MNEAAFRFLVVTFLAVIAVILAAGLDEAGRQLLRDFLVIYVKGMAVASVLIIIVVGVNLTWDGDRNVTDWLKPGSNRRRTGEKNR